MQKFDTAIIGAGQAGLAVSYYLTRQGRDHIVLEKHRIGEAWRSGKWDSFTLVTPNWMLQMPGFPYQGDDPDGFLSREELIDYLESYSTYYDLPVQSGHEVYSVKSSDRNSRYRLETNAGVMETRNVVVATGTFQQPGIPSLSLQLPANIQQLHSSTYCHCGKQAIIMPEKSFYIIDSRANLKGLDLGHPVHMRINPTIGNVALPRCPVFMIGQAQAKIMDHQEYQHTRRQIAALADP